MIHFDIDLRWEVNFYILKILMLIVDTGLLFVVDIDTSLVVVDIDLSFEVVDIVLLLVVVDIVLSFEVVDIDLILVFVSDIYLAFEVVDIVCYWSLLILIYHLCPDIGGCC